MIGNKQKSITQDYWAINKRSHIHNLRSFFSCIHYWRMHLSLFYFYRSIDFLPVWSLFLLSLWAPPPLLFFLKGIKKVFLNIYQKLLHSFPKAAQRNRKTKGCLSILGKDWFLKHFSSQTPVCPAKCLVGRTALHNVGVGPEVTWYLPSKGYSAA